MIETALSQLSLRHFRSHGHVVIETDDLPVVLYGPNGAGKTNVLEAISLLAPGRGLRRAPYVEAISRGSEQPWTIHARLQRGKASHEIGTSLQAHVTGQPAGNRRIVRIDGANASASALSEFLRIVWLTPAQDRIFSGPRSTRLGYYDRLVVSLFPTHGRAANGYERAQRQRTRLLEEGRADPAWLTGLEREMADHGARMIWHRVQALALLQQAIEQRGDSPFPRAALALSGDGEFFSHKHEDILVIATELLTFFAETRNRDQRAGRCLGGPHRANLAVQWAEKSMPARECSTGEQKALLTGMALAHARAVTADRNAPPPLILLDEACAHLDADRRAALIGELQALSGQAWLSGTDRDLFAAFEGKAMFLAVSEAGIARV